MSEPLYMSREGIEKLKERLKHLKFTERPRIVAEIKRAKELGDLSENAEYHAAKEAQTHIERKLAELEFKLAQVQPIDKEDIASDKAYLFAKVLVKNLKTQDETEYTLVPPDEDDVYKNVISIKSPIGAALLGKAIGEELEVKIPVGTLRLKIINITRD